MANVISSMSSSLDGFIADADGDFNWSAPDGDPVGREFAELRRPLPKIVLSTTLTEVEGNARLVTGAFAERAGAPDG